jgi:hypothetical protein
MAIVPQLPPIRRSSAESNAMNLQGAGLKNTGKPASRPFMGKDYTEGRKDLV